MHNFLRMVGCFAFASLLFRMDTAAPAAASVVWPTIGLREVVGWLDHTTNVVNAGDDSGRLFVTEQAGRILIIKNHVVLVSPFLDIRSRVNSNLTGERGLIGLAFPPGYAAKRYFYVDYNDHNGDIVIARYHLSADPDVADPNSESIILTIPHPDSEYHNGGQLAFGPSDGYLYIGVGDGGLQGDPLRHAQDTSVLLGKILRIDVESGAVPYAIPSTNPFAHSTTARHEIWAYGLRNPWRFSFDPVTQAIYIGDVGWDTAEEVDVEPDGMGGLNYGWRIMEGLSCTNLEPCNTAGLTTPIFDYDHSNGDSGVIGGYVYRGPHSELMRGKYFYGDLGSGRIGSAVVDNNAWQHQWLLDTALTISTFGEDEDGNLYVANYATGALDILGVEGVDAWLQAPAVIGAEPSSAALMQVRLGNAGLQTAQSVVVQAVLPAGLNYTNATPAPTSISGNTLTWSLPDLAFQQETAITLQLAVAPSPYGTRYSVPWQLTSTGPEDNSADNGLSSAVMVAHPTYLPVVAR